MKNFCTPFIVHAEDSIDSGKKKNVTVIKKELKHIKMQQNVTIVEKTYNIFFKR